MGNEAGREDEPRSWSLNVPFEAIWLTSVYGHMCSTPVNHQEPPDRRIVIAGAMQSGVWRKGRRDRNSLATEGTPSSP